MNELMTRLIVDEPGYTGSVYHQDGYPYLQLVKKKYCLPKYPDTLILLVKIHTRETKNRSTDADRGTNTILGGLRHLSFQKKKKI